MLCVIHFKRIKRNDNSCKACFISNRILSKINRTIQLIKIVFFSFIVFSFFFCLISLVAADRLETYVLVLFILYYLIYSCTFLSFYFTILYCTSRILVSFVSINFIIIIIINIIINSQQEGRIGQSFTKCFYKLTDIRNVSVLTILLFIFIYIYIYIYLLQFAI